MIVFTLPECPHCRSQQMTFQIFGVRAATPTQAKAAGYCYATIAATCLGCQLPVSGRVDSTRLSDTYPAFAQRSDNLVVQSGSLSDYEFEIGSVWPESISKAVPEYLPEAVEKAFLQGEMNFKMPDCDDAAALMYRRALELAMKDRLPSYVGSLAARIRQAVVDQHLPASMADWATEIRLVGNDGAHEEDGVVRRDLEDTRNFTDALLRYLYSLPGMVERRRQHREDAALR